MNRREFITLLGGAAAWPIAAKAQQPTPPVVSLVFAGSFDAFAGRIASFQKGLRQSGYTEGQNVTVEYHGLEGHNDRLPTLFDDLTRRNVAVIATPDGPISLAAKGATATIPIVFGVGADPVALGLVESLARPGGNATGVNFFSLEINAKRLGLMHELLPKAVRFAALINPADAPSAEATSKELKGTASSLGVEVLFFNASSPNEIETAFGAFGRERCDALFIAGDGFFASRQSQFVTLTARDRLPASCFSREMAQAGLLMSYGTDVLEMYRQIGIYVASILKGTKPADLPVLQLSKFQFVLNLQTARLLHVDVSPMLLARADEVIE